MRKFTRLVLFVLSLALVVRTANAETIFQVTGDVGSVNINGNALDELGDDVTFGGTARNLINVSVGTRFFFSQPDHVAYTPQLTLTLYSSIGATPTVIASSSVVAAPFVGLGGSQDQTVNFPFPGTLVPNSLWYTVRQDNFENNFALIFDGAPVVGSSLNTIAYSPQANASVNTTLVGAPTVQATFTAIPEPSTIVLAGLGGIAIVFAARRRQS